MTALPVVLNVIQIHTDLHTDPTHRIGKLDEDIGKLRDVVRLMQVLANAGVI